jgi:hypothetical protein
MQGHFLVVIGCLVTSVGCGDPPDLICEKIERRVCDRAVECRGVDLEDCLEAAGKALPCAGHIAVEGDPDACLEALDNESCANVNQGVSLAACDAVTFR